MTEFMIFMRISGEVRCGIARVHRFACSPDIRDTHVRQVSVIHMTPGYHPGLQTRRSCWCDVYSVLFMNVGGSE